MKNKFIKLIIFIFINVNLLISNAIAQEQFNFDITEIEIQENGNLFKGIERGTITTNDGLSIDADKFEYNKNLNLLKAFGKIEFKDKINNLKIFTDKITYNKDQEKILTQGNSKAINNNGIVITADTFKYNKIINEFVAIGNVKIENSLKDYVIFTDEVIYFKNQEKIITRGKTKSLIQSKYNFVSENVTFLVNQNKFSSKNKTTVTDLNSNFYQLDNFVYTINNYQLKGKNILVQTDYNLPKSDQFYFSSGIINLENKDFVAQDTLIKLHKGIFNNKENDPR